MVIMSFGQMFISGPHHHKHVAPFSLWSSEVKNISAIFKHVLFNVYSLLASDFFWNQRGDGDYDKCKLSVCCFQSLPTYE